MLSFNLKLYKAPDKICSDNYPLLLSGLNSADDKLTIFFLLLPEKKGIDISCKLHLHEMSKPFFRGLSCSLGCTSDVVIRRLRVLPRQVDNILLWRSIRLYFLWSLSLFC